MTNKKVTNTYMSDTELSSSSKSQPLRIAAPVVVAVALVAGFTPIFSSAPVSGSLSSSALLASATTFNVSTAAQLTSALSTAPAGTASSPTVISLAQGTYTGQFTVDQPYTELIGATGNAADVVITDNVTAAAGGSDKGSSTVINTASDTTFENLTIANTNTADAGANPPAGSQDVALYTSGDRQVYDNVSVLGYQDTLYLNTASSTGTDRSYFYNSYIQGAVDFIFGTGTAVFAYSTIDALDRVGGTVMAPNTYSGNARGYLFDHDRFISSTPTGGFNLGRAWPSSGQALGQATVENSTIDGGYSSTPWIDWTAGTAWQGTSRFYTANNSGPGAPSAANGNSTITDAAATPPVTQASWLAGTDGWNPLITPTAALPSAPTRLTSASTSQTSVTLTWSRGTDSTVVGYNIYRVSGGTPPTSLSGLSPLNSTPVTSNTYLNSGLSPNSTYSYVVVSVNAAGTPSALTATSSVTTSTPAPNITVSTTAELTSALAAVATNTAPYVIAIAPGTYTGPFTLAGNNVTLTSTVSTPSSVILTAASSAAGTATLTVSGTGDTVEGISVTQTGSDLGQGTPATHATGTQDTFDNDVITGGTRAVWADSSYFATQSQQLYENTTITGANDLALGRASAVFDNVTFDVTSSSGVVLVPSTATSFPGFLITDSTIAPATSVTNVDLGVPYIAYPNTYTPNSVGKAFVENSVLNAGINTTSPWGAGYNSNTSTNSALFTTGNYGEFDNTGAGAATAASANRPQLTAATLPSTVIGTGWYSLPAPPAVLAPGISGVVTDAQTGAPLAGICAYLYSSAGVRTSDPGTCTTANGSYTMPVATPGTYSLYFSDPAGIFTTASIAATVGSQGLTAINERLMPVVPQGVSGRVTDAQTGAPIAGVCVYLYTIAGVRTADTGFCTDTNGYYTESVATPGTYDVAFFDPSGLHITQWSGGAALQTGATAVTIAANTDTVGVNAPMAPAVTMGIMGSVTNAATGAPLPGVCVYLYTLAGTRTSDPGTCTSPNNGNYLMNVASPGTYKVAFTDPSGGPLASNGNYYATQWFGGAATEVAATTVTVTSGKATENISVAMAGA